MIVDRTKLEALLRATAPELSPWPLYIVTPSDMARACGRFGVKHLAGFTAPTLDLLLEPYLRQVGAWRGRGPALFVNPRTALRAELRSHRPADACPPGPKLLRSLAWRCAARVAVHELVHVVERGYPEWLEPPAAVRRDVARLVLWSIESEGEFRSPRPWDDATHGFAFFRMAAHVSARCPFHFSLEEITRPADRGIEAAEFAPLAQALLGEAARLRASSLLDVAATPPAADALAAWNAVVAEWSALALELAAARRDDHTNPQPTKDLTCSTK